MAQFQIESLPDEVVLKILEFISIKDVIQFGHVSKRLRKISQDESLWKTVRLFFKTVPVDFVESVINNGCKYLSLSEIKVRIIKS